MKPGHSAPWQAFCDAYFGRHPVSVWLGARALAGKSFTLAALGWTCAITLRANVSILGGSQDQSARVLEYLTAFWRKPGAPTEVLQSNPTQSRVDLVWGNKIRALAASQKQARGGHPQILLLDEADEMAWDLFQAVRHQPMGTADVPSRIVISSTHHYPDATMTKVLREAAEKGWPIYQWGFPETLEPHGWLTQAELERKRQQTTAQSWKVEVEMEEPSPEGRAVMTEMVELMFAGPVLRVREGEEAEFEQPVSGATYSHGADWGGGQRSKDGDLESHFTEIATLRTDVRPNRLVAYCYMRRRPYPEMTDRFDRRLARYPGSASHDYTGIGHIAQYMRTEQDVEDFTMVGRARTDLFKEYILAIERREILAPRIDRLYEQHKYVTNDDLYGEGHPPDGFVAMSMANRAAGRSEPVTLVSSTAGPSRLNEAELHHALRFLGRGGNGNGGNGGS